MANSTEKVCENMPRIGRRLSSTGIYHVVVRGINRQDIFHDKSDFIKYLDNLNNIMSNSDCRLLGYCLMKNHVHLLVDTGMNPSGISEIMQRLGTSYAQWYNRKYERCGHVFQNRFRNETIENEQYLLTVIRYIQLNPVKAGIVKKAEVYPWSSCRIYYGSRDYLSELIDTRRILDHFADTNEKAIHLFRRFMEEPNDDSCLDDIETNQITDSAAGKIITEVLHNHPVNILHQMPNDKRDKILRYLKCEKGLGVRQITRLTGLSYWTVYKA